MMNYFSNRKKWMAYLILLTFVFTCIVPTNLAGGNSAWADTVTNNQQQIVPNTGGLEPEDGNLNSDGVSVSKTIAYTEDENYFDITLKVNTEEDSESITKPADAAVVLVLDVSGSMKADVTGKGYCEVCAQNAKSKDPYYYVSGDSQEHSHWSTIWAVSSNEVSSNKVSIEKQSRFWRMSESLGAEDGFLDDFSNAGDATRMVSVVYFGETAKSVTGWVDLDDENGNKQAKAAVAFKTITGAAGTNEYGYPTDETGNILSGYTANIMGQTAQGKGLEIANDLVKQSLKNSKGEEITNKYVILLTDGRPEGSHGDGENNEEKAIDNQSGNHAEKYAGLIKEQPGVYLYTIGFGTETFSLQTPHKDSKTNLAVNSWMSNYLASRPNGVTGDPYITNPDDNKYFKPITANTSLAAALGDITKDINSASAAEPKTVTDKMGENVEFIGFCDGDNIVNQLGVKGKIATESDGIITWQVPESVDLDDADNKQIYKITYRVRLKTEADTFGDINQEQQYIAHSTNEFAKLVYDSVSKEDGTEISRVQNKEIAFPSPAVNGYLADLSFTKVDSLTGAPLNGAEFTLSHAANCDVCENKVTITDKLATSGVVGTTGEVNFTDIPSGHNYTLTEIEPPAGYLGKNAWNFKVSYGEIVWDDEALKSKALNVDANGIVTISNDLGQREVKVSGQKRWENVNGITLPENITIELFRDGVKVDQTTASAADWKYSFTDLPKYAIEGEGADGHAYKYTIQEVEIPGFTAGYEDNSISDEDIIIDIVNTPDTPMVPISGQKVWIDNGNQKHDPVTIELWRREKTEGIGDNIRINSVTVSEDTNWEYRFDDQPKYDKDGVAYYYYVKEANVPDGYVSIVSGYDVQNIQNELYEMGTVSVAKKVENTPANTTKFDFTMVVSALKKIEGVLDEATGKAKTQLATAVINAEKNLKEIEENLTGQNGSKALFENSAFMTTSSQYQFFVTDGNLAQKAVTTGSAIYVENVNMQLENKGSVEDGILAKIIRSVHELAQEFVNAGQERPTTTSVLTRIAQNVEVASGSAIAFDGNKLGTMFNDMVSHEQAFVEYENASDAYKAFKAEVLTTPSSLILIVNGDLNHPIKLDPASGVENKDGILEFNVQLEKDGQNKVTKVLYDKAKREYIIPFSLVANETISFSMEATTGSAIDYTIIENDSVKLDANYVNTYIYMGSDLDNALKLEEALNGVVSLETETAMLTSGSAVGYVFKNVYKTTSSGGTVPTPDPEDPPEKKKPTTPDPDETIPDENVPTGSVEPGEPLDEFDEPEIPLGDAPATGDHTNAVPFMALLFVAMAGLIITRRTFN